MNSLLICMTMCANCALAIYFILKKIFKVYLVPEIRYILLLIVMALYLFPFPLLKYDFINLLRGVFEEERVVSVLENRVEQYINLNKIIYVFLTIFLYLLKCPQSLILSALRAFCFCGKPHISRSIFLYFHYQAWLKSW